MKKIVVTTLSILAFSLTSFAQWATSGSDIYNTNTGNVGIGNTAPTSKLDVVGPGSSNSFLLVMRNNWSNAMALYSAGDQSFLQSSIGMFRARGTYQSPTTISSGDRIGSYGAFGYTTAYNTGAAMEMYAGSGLGTYILFGTTATPGASRLERVRITESGDVGIGTATPSQKLQVNGNIQCVNVFQSSDERFKTNIRKMENPLDKISRLQGVKYQFNRQQFKDKSFPDGDKDGLLAQQVQKIFPELVTTDAEGYLSVDYVSMIPILIESIKELKTKVDLLKAEKVQHELTVDQKKTLDRFKGAYLNQNAPNPSTNGTTIEFNIPDNVFSASIVVHDYNGNQVKKYEITQKGQGKIEIQNSEVGSGIFLYTLLLDGTVLDVKRMVLTKN
ncbi:MAG: tail fiber domain-containing protein [Bacteroidetes bacterium]|nr:tail fiber domain-containing protein [Bacteroidota bacterium]